MRALAILRSLWLTLVRRERLEQSLDEELRAYVDLLAAEYEAAGMDPAQARRRALIETGGIEQVEATRGPGSATASPPSPARSASRCAVYVAHRCFASWR